MMDNRRARVMAATVWKFVQ